MIGKYISKNTRYEFDKSVLSPIVSPGITTKNVKFSGLAAILSVTIGITATPYMGLATLAFSFLCIGLISRRHRAQHVIFMNLAIALDLAIVLALEIQRNAVATAISFTLSPLQQAHIGTSSVATALYIPVLILGWMRYRGSTGAGLRTWHLRLGLVAFVFRALGFISMFALMGRHTVGG